MQESLVRMIRSLAARSIYTVLVVVAAMSIVFALLQLSGDPAAALIPPGSDPADVAVLRAKFGLDQPLPRQYIDYMRHAVTGDFGNSWRTGQPAMALVMQRLGATLLLTGTAFGLALLVAVPLECWPVRNDSGRSAGWQVHSGCRTSAASLLARDGADPVFQCPARLVARLRRRRAPALVLPAVALAAFPAATLMRIVRVSVADVAGADFVRTAHAKGLSGRAILWGHIARTAMLPAIAYAGVAGGFLVAGAVAVESVFAWPGIGQLALQSVASRDLPVIQAFVAVVAVLIVLANLAADLVALLADPLLREAAAAGAAR